MDDRTAGEACQEVFLATVPEARRTGSPIKRSPAVILPKPRGCFVYGASVRTSSFPTPRGNRTLKKSVVVTPCHTTTAIIVTRWPKSRGFREREPVRLATLTQGLAKTGTLVPWPSGATGANPCDYWPETQRPADLRQRVIRAERAFSPNSWWRRGESKAGVIIGA